jgi:hypothetical protein
METECNEESLIGRGFQDPLKEKEKENKGERERLSSN